MYNEALGKLHFWMMFIGFQLVFIPMFEVGVQGMNRRIADYPAAYEGLNVFITLSALFLGASFVFFAWNLVLSWISGPVAESNPWRVRTLEWQTSSPPPLHNFDADPVITGNPYDYGQSHAAPHARLGLAPSAGDGA
jgi:cytochrome c oxidase subunit 1